MFLCYQVIIQKKIDYLGSSGTYCTPCTAQLRESTNQKREAFCLCPKQPITVQSSQGHVTSYCRAKFDEKCFEKSLDGALIQKVVLKWPFVVIQRHLFLYSVDIQYSVTRYDYFLIQKWHFLTVTVLSQQLIEIYTPEAIKLNNEGKKSCQIMTDFDVSFSSKLFFVV